jgi:hypothetical protein
MRGRRRFSEVRRAAERPPIPQLSKTPSRHMSARQPFVPSRPASRAVNLSEETRAIAKDAFTHAVSSTNPNASNTTSTEKKNSGSNNLDLEVNLTLPPPSLIHDQIFIVHRAPSIAPSTSPVSRSLLRVQLVPLPAQTPQRILDLTLARPNIRTKIKIWRTAAVAAAPACWDVQRVRVSIAAAQHHLRAYMRLAHTLQAHPLLE